MVPLFWTPPFLDSAPFFGHFFEKFMFCLGTPFFNNPKKYYNLTKRKVELVVNNYENLEIVKNRPIGGLSDKKVMNLRFAMP